MPVKPLKPKKRMETTISTTISFKRRPTLCSEFVVPAIIVR
ncbi:Uncharacterised protein [Vibrio cholerae]|nr:Uncharacterised protein [Vibrio cholerae]